MLSELLWVIGLYAGAAACAHWLISRSRSLRRQEYVLVAGNHERQIEGYVRALQQYARRSGTDIGITVLLAESSDDTGAIMERLIRNEDGVALARTCDGVGMCTGDDRDRADANVVWVSLDKQEELERLPLK